MDEAWNGEETNNRLLICSGKEIVLIEAGVSENVCHEPTDAI